MSDSLGHSDTLDNLTMQTDVDNPLRIWFCIQFLNADICINIHLEYEYGYGNGKNISYPNIYLNILNMSEYKQSSNTLVLDDVIFLL